MKFWSISLVACLLLSMGCSTTKPTASAKSGYTINANETEFPIMWQGQPIAQGAVSNMTVEVSPDGQSVAWTVTRQNGVRHIDSTDDPILEGTLWMAQAGQQPMQIVDTRSSRGWELDFANYQDEKASWYPIRLQWDSTSQYLYFTTQPWITRKMLWQLKPGRSVPRAIVPLWDFRLLKRASGPDWVEAYETKYAPPPVYRDWVTTSIYTPEEMAKDKYVKPAMEGRFSKEWQPGM